MIVMVWIRLTTTIVNWIPYTILVVIFTLFRALCLHAIIRTWVLAAAAHTRGKSNCHADTDVAPEAIPEARGCRPRASFKWALSYTFSDFFRDFIHNFCLSTSNAFGVFDAILLPALSIRINLHVEMDSQSHIPIVIYYSSIKSHPRKFIKLGTNWEQTTWKFSRWTALLVRRNRNRSKGLY